MERMLSLTVLLSTIAIVASWGPVTHYEFACKVFDDSSSTLPECIASCVNGNSTVCDLLIGSAMPDAFFFGAQPFMQNSTCPPEAVQLHDPVFAGFLVEWAGAQPASSSFDPVMFAHGFGSHIMGDLVGFANPQSYFMADRDRLVNGVVDWLYTWPVMLGVDSYVLYSSSYPQSMSLPSQLLQQEGADMLAQATEKYQSIDSSFPVLNSSAIMSCSSAWSQHLRAISHMTVVESDKGIAEGMLGAYDPFHSSSVSDAAQSLELQVDCAVDAVQHWVSELMETGSPSDASTSTFLNVTRMFRNGQCTVK